MSYASLEERIVRNSVTSPEHFYEDEAGIVTLCWVWVGPLNTGGYARMCVRDRRGPRNVLVHRLSLRLFRGVDVQFDVARHLCNFRRCVNPMHLEPGTQSENMLQCVAEGRHNRKNYEREPGGD